MSNYKRFTSNAGHSQLTEGATGNGYEEHDEALKYHNEFTKQMKAVGYAVTNTTSEAKGAQAVLSEQAKKANAVNKDGRLDVSWHFNSAKDNKATGVEVLYYDQKELAEEVSAAVAKALGLRNRGAKERKELYFLRNTNAPAILIEVAFISNADDMKQATTKRATAVTAVVDVLTGKKAVTPPKPTASTPANPFAGKRLASKINGLRFYSKPSWADKDVVGTVNKGIGFPTVLAKVNVAGSPQYKVQNSKGATFYITASNKYIELKAK